MKPTTVNSSGGGAIKRKEKAATKASISVDTKKCQEGISDDMADHSYTEKDIERMPDMDEFDTPEKP